MTGVDPYSNTTLAVKYCSLCSLGISLYACHISNSPSHLQSQLSQQKDDLTGFECQKYPHVKINRRYHDYCKVQCRVKRNPAIQQFSMVPWATYQVHHKRAKNDIFRGQEEDSLSTSSSGDPPGS